MFVEKTNELRKNISSLLNLYLKNHIAENLFNWGTENGEKANQKWDLQKFHNIRKTPRQKIIWGKQIQNLPKRNSADKAIRLTQCPRLSEPKHEQNNLDLLTDQHDDRLVPNRLPLTFCSFSLGLQQADGISSRKNFKSETQILIFKNFKTLELYK